MTTRIPQTIHLILDFDSTLTISDTLAPLSQLGYTSHPSSLPPAPPWPNIVSAYLNDLKQHTTTYPTPPAARKTLAQEAEWLSSLRHVERASFERAVLEAGIWEGLDVGGMVRGARGAVEKGDVGLREGWEECIERVVGEGGKCSIVSVNWSRAWVWGCLSGGCNRDVEGSMEHKEIERVKGKENVRKEAEENVRMESEENVSVGEGGKVSTLEKVEVWANEVPSVEKSVPALDGRNCLPGGSGGRIHTADDKLRVMRSLTESNGSDRASSLTIYVGDSTSDLLCLLDADVGICMRDEPMGSGMRDLETTCKRLGIALQKLGSFDFETVEQSADEARRSKHNWEKDWKRRLYWATDFVVMDRWLRDLQAKISTT